MVIICCTGFLPSFFSICFVTQLPAVRAAGSATGGARGGGDLTPADFPSQPPDADAGAKSTLPWVVTFDDFALYALDQVSVSLERVAHYFKLLIFIAEADDISSKRFALAWNKVDLYSGRCRLQLVDDGFDDQVHAFDFQDGEKCLLEPASLTCTVALNPAGVKAAEDVEASSEAQT